MQYVDQMHPRCNFHQGIFDIAFVIHKPQTWGGGREREGKVGKIKEMKKMWKEGKKSKNTANVWKNLALEPWRWAIPHCNQGESENVVHASAIINHLILKIVFFSQDFAHNFLVKTLQMQYWEEKGSIWDPNLFYLDQSSVTAFETFTFGHPEA